MHHCLEYKSALLTSASLTVSKVFIHVPFCILILHLGYQRWRRRGRSFASASHSDIITYHLVALQLLFVLGGVLYLCGLISQTPNVTEAGIYVSMVIFPGETLLHILTCVERYLAVVRPITYLRLRQSGGVRIRNISIGGAWLLSFGWIGVIQLYFPALPYVPTLCFLVATLVLVLICNVSVLLVLIRPGPGNMGGERRRVAQTKRKAFCTISAILGVLLVFFIGIILILNLEWSHLLSSETGCLLLVSGNLFNLPSNLVLPLLFLHQARRLCCCRRNGN